MTRLFGHARKQGSLLLGLDHSDGFPVDQQEVVAGARLQRGFTQGDASSSRRIELFVSLNGPTAGNELVVDLLAGALFGCFRHESCRIVSSAFRPDVPCERRGSGVVGSALCPAKRKGSGSDASVR